MLQLQKLPWQTSAMGWPASRLERKCTHLLVFTEGLRCVRHEWNSVVALSDGTQTAGEAGDIPVHSYLS